MSTIQLSKFEQQKSETLLQLRKVKEIANELHAPQVSQKIKETIEDLQHEQFMLSVVGEFSRGKSMFINALLGSAVLPSKTKPTTAFINQIRYGEQPSFNLVYRDPARPLKALTHEEFLRTFAPSEPDEDDAEEVSEYKSKTEEFDSLKWAQITYPNHFCKEGIEIYDTPGVNDPNPNREEITFTFIPKSDAVLFLISATTPLSQSELDFLNHRIYNSDISKVFFVINFKDRLESIEKEEEVMHYIKKHIQKVEPNPRIYLISSKDALTIKRLEKGEVFKVSKQKFTSLDETGLPALEQGIADFLQNEKAETKLTKPIKRGIKFSSELINNSIAVRLSSLDLEFAELVSKINKTKEKVILYKKEAQKIAASLSNHLSRDLQLLIDEAKKNLQIIEDAVMSEIENYNEDLNEEAIKSLINRISLPLQKEMQSSLNDMRKKIIHKHLENAYSLLSEQNQNLDQSVIETFDIQFDSANFNLSIYEKNEFNGVLVAGSIGLGILAAAAAPLLIPIGFLGALFFGGGIVNSIQQSKREQKMRQIKSKVKSGLIKSRRQSIQKLEEQWVTLKNTIMDDFHEEYYGKAVLLEDEMTLLGREHLAEQEKIEERRQYYLTMKTELILASSKLKELEHSFSKSVTS